jgi:hypothetical protein
VIHVGKLEGAECSAVPESGMFPLASGENASWRRQLSPADYGLSAEDVGDSLPWLRADLQEKGRHLRMKH